MFNYVLEFPHVVQRCLTEDRAGNLMGPHLICSFLTGLVNVFSVYYRRVRILDVSLLRTKKSLKRWLNCVSQTSTAQQRPPDEQTALPHETHPGRADCDEQGAGAAQHPANAKYVISIVYGCGIDFIYLYRHRSLNASSYI